MDIRKDGVQRLFGWRLAMVIGLRQILDPSMAKVCGFNVYHLALMLGLVIPSFTMITLSLVGLYRWWNARLVFTLYIGYATQLSFSCFKITQIMRHSGILWECYESLAARYMPSGTGTSNWHWRRLSVRLSLAVVSMFALLWSVWAAYPYAFSGRVSSTMVIKGSAGVEYKYRFNVYNFNVPISDTTYNENFYVFYCLEMIVLTNMIFSSMIFDLIILTICSAICFRLEMISDATRVLGHASGSQPEHVAAVVNNITILKEKCDVYDELKTIIKDHQKVVKVMRDFYRVFRPLILFQIFTSSYAHVYIMFLAAINNQGLIDFGTTIKVFLSLPMFSYQLFSSSKLFDSINEKNDSIIFALYSSNWTEMNKKSQQLVFLAMTMMNANNLKMKFSHTKIVNLELYSATMRFCYSMFSMLLNVTKK